MAQWRLGARALPSLIKTWVWRRKEWLARDDAWWKLARAVLKVLILTNRDVLGRFVQERRNEAMDLYRAVLEQLLGEGDSYRGVSLLALVCPHRVRASS